MRIWCEALLVLAGVANCYDTFVSKAGKVKRICYAQLRGDSAYETCSAFCKEKHAARHCRFCKCSGCAFCVARGIQNKSVEEIKRLGSFTFLPNGCSWHETTQLGGCIRLKEQRAECKREAVQGLSQAKSEAQVAHRLAVIVPYRSNGNSDLSPLCDNLPTHLEAEHVDYRLFLVDQQGNLPFNRGALINAAVDYLLRERRKYNLDDRHTPQHFLFDYLAIHDADRFPVASAHALCPTFSHSYYDFPQHVPRVLHPKSLAGGVLIVQLSHFLAVNGFSNQFWGWGEEDNNLFLRLRWCGLAPVHGDGVWLCMEHRDCAACRSAKRRVNATALSALTANGRQDWRQMSIENILSDGLSNVIYNKSAEMHTESCGVAKLLRMRVSLHLA
eukprot:6210200-Pleurochrysis_carterae.AAC.1